MSYAPGSGLTGVVEWTERGRSLIRSGAFRYLSPVVIVRQNDNRVIAIHSAALTVKPAIPRAELLAASQHFKERRAMNEGDVVATAEQKIGELKALLETKSVELGDGSDFVSILNAAIALIKGKAAPATAKALADDPFAEGVSEGESDGVVAKIAKALGVSGSGDLSEVLTRILAAVKSKANNEPTDADASDDEAVANSVRKALNLDATAGADEVVLAMRQHNTDGSASREIIAMRQAERERVATEHVDRYVNEGKLLPSDTEGMEAAKSLALNNPARLDALLGSAVPIVPQGRMTAPSTRQVAMTDAQRTYRRDAGLQKACSERAYVRQSLSDAGLATLSDTEASEFNG